MFFYTFLPKLLNMSLTASVVILFVLLLRLLLKKAPKVISYALWSVVLFRLLCPVSIQSDLSLFGLLDTPVIATDNITSRIEYIPSDIVSAEYPSVSLSSPGPGDTNGGILSQGKSKGDAVDDILSQGEKSSDVLWQGEKTDDILLQGEKTDDILLQGEKIDDILPQREKSGDTLRQGEAQPAADSLETPMMIAVYVWLTGVLAMVIHAAVSYIRLRRKLITASPLRDNIYLADEITSPFVMGLFWPKIFLPSSVKEQEQSYILAHERHHIRRFDHIIKVLAFAALCIHWFNPLAWVAFLLAGKDMEMSCDEAVIRKMGTDVLADYTASLLSLATGKHIVAGISPAFGEGDTKGRIRNLASWKKPAFWIVLLSVIVCAVAAVCFLTNPEQKRFSLSIVVPAGSQAPVVYTHEEISPLGNTIIITSGEGLGDTEVSLKPVEVRTETAYDQPVYLTPGMPVKMEAEKGGWFKIGVNVQNDTDEDKTVYVNVENVTVRIADVSEPDTFLMEAEILEVHEGYFLVEPVEGSPELNSADQIKVPVKHVDSAQEPLVGDIIEVSYNGEILETYPAQLSEVYSIRISAKKVAMKEEPSVGEEDSMGEGKFTEEIRSAESEDLLTEAIYNAILDHNKSAGPDDLYHCASFVLLDKDELCIDSDPITPMEVTVYGFALYQAYEYSGDGFREVLGSHIPVAITFEIRDGEYVLREYWEPRDGSYYVKDIRDIFPDAIAEDAIDTQKYIYMQKQDCYAQAVEHGDVDTDAVMEQLFEAIESSPAHASNPGDYIREHSIEYRELLYYGQYTLRYCFEQFQQGGQTGLHGHIMASACRDIMSVWGEEDTTDKDSGTGQDWFEAFKSNAEHSDEAERYPGAWLLMHMSDGQ